MKFLKRFKNIPFFPITSGMAVRIAPRRCLPPLRDFSVLPEKPDNAHIFNAPTEPAWYVFCPWNDGHLMLRSSRVIAISKRTGRVLYDGSANDEG